jgi:hydrogenase nickel incorporation protein HypA/HybF
MHEWALAESILTAAVETANKEKLKTIKEIRISIGELQQIEIDIFQFAIDEIIKTQSGIIKNAKTIIKTKKSTLKCKNCEHKWDFNDMKKKLNEDESEFIHFLPEVAFVHTRCLKCGSPDFEIIEGRGVTITSIKGER